MSSGAYFFGLIVKEPLILVVIVPVVLLLFLLKQTVASVPDAVRDFKKSGKKSDGVV